MYLFIFSNHCALMRVAVKTPRQDKKKKEKKIATNTINIFKYFCPNYTKNLSLPKYIIVKNVKIILALTMLSLIF